LTTFTHKPPLLSYPIYLHIQIFRFDTHWNQHARMHYFF
jgi:hypothetical protein